MVNWTIGGGAWGIAGAGRRTDCVNLVGGYAAPRWRLIGRLPPHTTFVQRNSPRGAANLAADEDRYKSHHIPPPHKAKIKVKPWRNELQKPLESNRRGGRELTRQRCPTRLPLPARGSRNRLSASPLSRTFEVKQQTKWAQLYPIVFT